MTSTSRRTVLKSLVAGGALVGAVPEHASAQHGRVHVPPALAHATVVFGQWNTPIDRFVPAPPTPAQVGHHVSPNEVTIGVNGSVAFLIGGFHLLLIYEDGKLHQDVNTSDLIPAGGGFPPLIQDLNNILYRGLDPRISAVDRVEVVHFHEPGRYLMACGVLPHFHEMYGYIRVVGR